MRLADARDHEEDKSPADNNKRHVAAVEPEGRDKRCVPWGNDQREARTGWDLSRRREIALRVR